MGFVGGFALGLILISLIFFVSFTDNAESAISIRIPWVEIIVSSVVSVALGGIAGAVIGAVISRFIQK